MIHAGVIRQRIDAVAREELRDLLNRVARQAVDDAGFPRMFLADEAQQLLARLALGDDAVADVGPVEARDKLARLEQQPLGDLAARRFIGSRGQRDTWHVAVALA